MNKRIEQLMDMLKSEPEDTFLNYALAMEYAAIGQNKNAIDLLETILQKDPSYLGTYYQLGKIYEGLSQNEKAITTYKKGMVLSLEQKNNKTFGELNTALMLLEEE